MIGFRQVEELLNVKNGSTPLTSLYLTVDGRRFSKRDCENALKDLMKEKEREASEFQKSDKASLGKDFEKIRRWLSSEFDWKGKRSVALFSCTATKFWQVYPLPRPVKNILVIDRSPYLRPLIALFDDYRRFCMVLVDKTKARIFEVFLGEIEEHTEIMNRMPRKSKAGGWKGYEEHRRDRHMIEEVHRHFKRVGDALMDFFKLYRFDGLILGGHRSLFSEFERELHPHLKERIVGRLELDLHAATGSILEKAMAVEASIRKEQGEKLVKRLQELTGERMAVMGILGTLTAHRRGQIHSLVVSKNYQVSGARCPDCAYLDREGKMCPVCKKPMQATPDLVDDLIEAAVSQGCKVEYVWDNGRVDLWGGIGAVLRYKI